MANRIHPCGFSTLVVRKDCCDVFVNVLQSKGVVRRCQDGATDDRSVGEVRFDGGIGTRRKDEGQVVLLWGIRLHGARR